MHIQLVPAFSDNYIYLLDDPASGVVGVVDPGDGEVVADALDRQGKRLTHIFATHHHADHVGGTRLLVERYGATVIGARHDAGRIPEIGTMVEDGDSFEFGAGTVRVIDTPGHTVGHIAFWFAADDALFCGDTLFALGCGRLFEGTARQMWDSLSRLRALPEETRVFCGHEYTLSNARFAVHVDPENAALAARAEAVRLTRERGEPTIPSTLAEERATNPFLRADAPALQARLGMAGADPMEVFAELRRRKDTFA